MAMLLLFGMARETAGHRRIQIEGRTVSDVVARASEQFGPDFAAVAACSSFMVNGERAVPQATLEADSELAILPPVSGGEGPLRVALLTVSDRVGRDEASDETGPAVERALPFPVSERKVVVDARPAIESALIGWCDRGFELVLTNGGTGLSTRDVTPEATLAVVDRLVPGLAELMRAKGSEHTALASLSRQVVGTRGRTLIANLPGSPRGAVESLEAIRELLPHALAMLGGGDHDRR